MLSSVWTGHTLLLRSPVMHLWNVSRQRLLQRCSRWGLSNPFQLPFLLGSHGAEFFWLSLRLLWLLLISLPLSFLWMLELLAPGLLPLYFHLGCACLFLGLESWELMIAYEHTGIFNQILALSSSAVFTLSFLSPIDARIFSVPRENSLGFRLTLFWGKISNKSIFFLVLPAISWDQTYLKNIHKILLLFPSLQCLMLLLWWKPLSSFMCIRAIPGLIHHL